MTYHIINMVPAYPDRVNQTLMDSFKITIANHAVVSVASHNQAADNGVGNTWEIQTNSDIVVSYIIE